MNDYFVSNQARYDEIMNGLKVKPAPLVEELEGEQAINGDIVSISFPSIKTNDVVLARLNINDASVTSINIIDYVVVRLEDLT